MLIGQARVKGVGESVELIVGAAVEPVFGLLGVQIGAWPLFVLFC